MLREGELCIEEGAWGLHMTPSFPRLGSIFKYPEYGSMAGMGGRIQEAGWGLAGGQDPAKTPSPPAAESPQALGPQWEGAAVPLSEPEGRIPFAEREGQRSPHAKWGAGWCLGQEVGLWAESPSWKLREGAVDGAGKGVCRGSGPEPLTAQLRGFCVAGGPLSGLSAGQRAAEEPVSLQPCWAAPGGICVC